MLRATRVLQEGALSCHRRQIEGLLKSGTQEEEQEGTTDMPSTPLPLYTRCSCPVAALGEQRCSIWNATAGLVLNLRVK